MELNSDICFENSGGSVNINLSFCLFKFKQLLEFSLFNLWAKWLKSSLEFDKEFDPRQIEINGEFYFSVVEGKSPFIINTELGEVKVIGTKFSVKTNKEEIEIEVEEGTVELNTKQYKSKLIRGEHAIYKKSENGIRKGKAKFKFKIWMNNLKIEFKKLGREIKRSSKDLSKESKKVGKELKKELKKLKTK